ncbi:hypothetical protein KP509_14G026700 [Ceratopteris richardii]|nr:hypothetical protein KP509_14G026700 [Ceratopteris richardii]
MLRRCKGNRDAELIQGIYLLLCATGLDIHNDVGNHVVPLLVESTGLWGISQQAFNRMDHHTIHSWNSFLSGFGKLEQPEHSLKIYQRMLENGTCPSSHTYVALLHSCIACEAGSLVHSSIVQDGFESDVFVGSSLVDMYSKSGFIYDAQVVFDCLLERDVVTWNALMAPLIDQDSDCGTFHHFERMKIEGVMADLVSYIYVLKACGCTKAIKKGHFIHAELEERGIQSSFLSNAIIDMYAKCGCLDEAHLVFSDLPVHDVVTWNSLIAGYAEHGPFCEALKCFGNMQLEDIAPDLVSFVCVIKACGLLGEVGMAQAIHSEIIMKGIEGENDIGNCLVHMYADAGLILEAQMIFDMLLFPSALAWNALITGLEVNGLSQKLMESYPQTKMDNALSNPIFYSSYLRLCLDVGDKDTSYRMFEEVLCKGQENHPSVGRNLVSIFANSGLHLEAQAILGTSCIGDFVIAWNALLAACLEYGLCHDAFQHFEHMKQKGISPDAFTFVHILQACTCIQAVSEGQTIHKEAIILGFERDTLVGNTLISMYIKNFLSEEALFVLTNLQSKDSVTWNTLISGYVDIGASEAALNLYEQLQMEGVTGDCVTVTSILKACGNTRAMKDGQQLHSDVVKRGLESDIIVSNVLIFMYFKFCLHSDARAVFDMIPHKNVVTWNTMLEGYVDSALEYEAMHSFNLMQLGPTSPNCVTYACMFKAYIACKAFDKGQSLHSQVIIRGLEGDPMIGNLLVNMYAKFGTLALAQQVFDMLPVTDYIPWTALIGGYVEQGLPLEALQCFEKMQQAGVLPDVAALASVLKACRSKKNEEKFFALHNETVIKGLEGDLSIGSTLVNVYAKWGMLADAHQVFNKLDARNAVSWMGLILGYVENGSLENVWHCYRKIPSEGVVLDPPLFACIIAACSNFGAVQKILVLHVDIVQKGYEMDLFITSSLIHSYATCGFLMEAYDTFHKFPEKNVVSWSAMIKGFGLNHSGQSALKCFEDMQRTGFVPNAVTFTNLISACSHSSFIGNDHHYSTFIEQISTSMTTLNHLTGMTCLLSRTGQLDEAKQLLMSTPWAPDDDTWVTLLTSCKVFLEAALGHSCFGQLIVHEGIPQSLKKEGISLGSEL